MDTRYNIYFAGQLLEGQELASVRARMAKLFNANDTTLDTLFSGKNQLVKRDCDRATALKYKQAIESAGGVPLIKAIAANAATTVDSRADAPMTAAQKIAALAAVPDQRQAPSAEPAAKSERSPTERSPDDLQLAPAGTAVLLPEERQAEATAAVSAPDLDVDTAGGRLSEVSPPAPPAPDTSHLSEGPVGEIIPVLPVSNPPLTPDISAIELAPDGTDLSDCAPAPPDEPDLDLSGIELAPTGSDVLEQRYRQKHDTPAPATDHITLED